MASESNEWPYSLFYQNIDNYPCCGRYAILDYPDKAFDVKHNSENYVAKAPGIYVKLSDRELTEW